MKVLMILTAAFDQGGTQNDMIQLSQALGKLGYDIHVAAPSGSLQEELIGTGATFHDVPSPVGGPGALLGYTRGIASILRKTKFDILAPQSIRASLAAGLLRGVRVSRAPIITSLHNLHDPGTAGLAARILRRCCDVVTFENNYEKQLVGLDETRVGKAPKVVYSGVDLDKFSPHSSLKSVPGLPACKGKLAVCVARLSEEKNHQTLLRAWAVHSEDNPWDHLALVGDGPCRKAIEASIEKLNLESVVTLLGDRNDVEQILPHFDLFVLSSSRESYPRSAREALACGVPVILPAIGGCREIVEKCGAGALFKSEDYMHLARLISSYLEFSGRTSRLRLAARHHAEINFPLEKWRDTMDRLYGGFCPENVAALGNSEVASC